MGNILESCCHGQHSRQSRLLPTDGLDGRRPITRTKERQLIPGLSSE